MNGKKGKILFGFNKETTDNSVKTLLNKLNVEILEYTDGYTQAQWIPVYKIIKK